MGILGAESNRADLLQELRRADQGSWTRLTPEKTAHNSSDNPFSAFRFPFIATCLAIGASVNSELALGASGNARLFQLDLDCDDTANDDGISVFDITNPSQPRYGFVLLRGEGDQEIDEEVEDADADPPYRRRKIINAKTYLCTYYPTEKERLKMDVNDILADLAKRPLISAAALEDIWPDKGWRGGDSNALSCEATATSRTSLKEKALAKAVDEAFAGSKEHNGWLWSAEQIPGFSSAVLARLHATPKLLHSPSGMQLLIGALRGRSDVDLRMFRGLKPSDAANILATLRDNQKDGPRALHLSLPDLEGWRVKDLDSVLAAAPVASLSLGETPSMSLAETLASALKHDVKGFISTALYRRPFELSRKRYSEIDALSGIDFFPPGVKTPYPLSQCVYMRHCGQNAPRLCNGDGIAWKRYIDGLMPSWAGSDYVNDGLIVMPLPLRDVLLPPEGIARRIPKVLGSISQVHDFDFFAFQMSGVGTHAAEQLAVGEDLRVSCVPGEMYADYSRAGRSSAEPFPSARPVRFGEWTLLVMHEAPGFLSQPSQPTPPNTFRYAFVTRDEAGGLRTLGADDFFSLEQVPQSAVKGANAFSLADQWRRNMAASMTGSGNQLQAHISSCGSEEASEAAGLLQVYTDRIETFKHQYEGMRARGDPKNH